MTVQEKPASLEAVANLFRALRGRGIRYCHWKSNTRLELALRGRTDLDLLVDRAHSQAFRQVLFEHDVKPIAAPPGKRYPGLEDYLGFDPASGQSFHLHVHYQLVLGEQFVKNYRLPLETQFLDSVRQQCGVNVPALELELIVLALRALLKYRDRDALKDVLSIRSPGLPPHILDEIRSLLAQTTLEQVAERLARVADVAPAEVVLEFLRTVVATPRAGYQFYRLRQRVRQALRPYQRYSRPQATLKYFQEMWRRRRSFLKFSPNRGMTPVNGGVTLALVGADGAGKSTMCQMLAKWLSWKLDVHVYYLGSKQPSRLSRGLYLVFRMARRSQRAVARALGEAHLFSRWVGGLRDGLLCLHHLSIGQDRYRRYLAGRKKALDGSVVIFDRYPLETISTRREYRLLDGPQIPLTVAGEHGPVIRALARMEEDLYRRFHLPDYLFVLDVSPDVSMQRKPDHSLAAVEAKTQAVGELTTTAQRDAGKSRLFHLNADLPFETVVSQLKSKLWEAL